MIKSVEFKDSLNILNGLSFFSYFFKLKYPIFTPNSFITVIIAFRNFRLGNIIIHLSLLFLVSLLTIFCDLLTCFYLVFIFIHSTRHLGLSVQRKHLNFSNYLIILLPISLLSILGIYYFKQTYSGEIALELFLVIGVGSLTFPHFLVESLLSGAPR